MIVFDFHAPSFPRPGPDGRTDQGRLWSPFEFAPVLLHVAGVDLMSDAPDGDGATVAQGLGLPLPEVALWGRVALYHAAREGRSAYEMNEHAAALLFQANGDDLLVHSTSRERTVRVSYRRLLDAWEAFDWRARQFLTQTFEHLDRHPRWSETMAHWLRGELNVTTWSPPAASMLFFGVHEHAFDHVDAAEPEGVS